MDTVEHLGLILGSQKQADALLEHFGSLTVLARASVDELLPFVSRCKALRLVSSLRMGALALREERQSLKSVNQIEVEVLVDNVPTAYPSPKNVTLEWAALMKMILIDTD